MPIDWDSIFEYQTIKVVRIHDRRLGILHYTFQFCILIYIVVYTIVLQERYLLTEIPLGTIRSTLKEPSAGDWANATDLPYCYQNQPELVTPDASWPNFNCTYMLGYDLTYPPSPSGSIFATTRIKYQYLSTPPSCPTPQNPISLDCAPQVGEEINYYTADIEDFTIYMQHAIYGRITHISETNSGLEGELIFKNDPKNLLKLSGVRGGDIFTIRTMLQAAGIDSLDVYSDVAGGNSLRFDGVELMVVVTYANSPSNPDTLTYSYTVTYVPGIDSVAMEPTSITDGSLVERTRHGINFVFVMAGSIGVFDFPTLLVNIVSGVVLLKISTTIVDLLMMYVLKEKEQYKNHKYEEVDHGIIRRPTQPISPDPQP